MKLTRHRTANGPRWALDGSFLEPSFTLSSLLAAPAAEVAARLDASRGSHPAEGPLLAPVEDEQEVWAAGVTYLRSREAREGESAARDVYTRVYAAERPDLFFKAVGRRVVGPGARVRCRADSSNDVPEPELTLLVNAHGDVLGYTAGNDMTSRAIEGANPLYLPQAKMFRGSCAVGPALCLQDEEALTRLPITMDITRGSRTVFSGATNTRYISRPLASLVDFLFREMDFPAGVLLMTGTGIVPPEDFTLQPGDDIHSAVGDLVLQNPVDG